MTNMATPKTTTRTPAPKKPLGRPSKFRSKKPKLPLSVSVTRECVTQVKIEVERAGYDIRSEWFEDVVWKIAGRRRPL